MDLELIILSQVSLIRERQIIYDITYVWYLNDTNEFIYKTNRLTELENKLWLPKGKGGGEDKEVGVNIYTLLYIQ